MQVKHLMILGAVLAFLASCGSKNKEGTATSNQEIVEITVINRTTDTLYDYGLDVDLIPMDTNMHLVTNGLEIPFQFEDRNVNGLPDRLFASVHMLPQTSQKLHGELHTTPRTKPVDRVQVVMQDAETGASLSSYVHGQTNALRHGGVILENDRIGYRALMRDAFAFDVIGKRFGELMVHQQDDLSEESKWGGDVLDEGQSLGIGSPAIYDLSQIVRFDVFDEREVKVIASGPLRAEIEMILRGIPVRDEKVDIAVTMEMQAGAQYVDVTLELLSRTSLTIQFAFGLPKHEEATDFTQGLESNTHFAYTYGLQSAQGEQLGLALLVSNQYEIDHYRGHPEDYFYLATPIDKKVSYRFLAAWVKGPRTIFEEVDFLNFARAQAKLFANQPTVEVNWKK